MALSGIHVFLNGDRGLFSLRALLHRGFGIDQVVIPPGKPKVAEAVRAMGASVRVQADVHDSAFLGQLDASRPELFIIAGYSTIFRPELFSVPRLGCLNLHAGRLPQYRGGSPLNWQVINGEHCAGLSVIRVDSGIDTGPVLAETTIPIGTDTTIADLHDLANQVFPGLLLEAVEAVISGQAGRIQDESQAVYWHQRNDVDGQLRPREISACQALDFIRALTRPYPGAWIRCAGRIVRILSAAPAPLRLRGNAGRLCHIQGTGPLLVCRDQAILLREWRCDDGSDAIAALRHGVVVD